MKIKCYKMTKQTRDEITCCGDFFLKRLTGIEKLEKIADAIFEDFNNPSAKMVIPAMTEDTDVYRVFVPARETLYDIIRGEQPFEVSSRDISEMEYIENNVSLQRHYLVHDEIYLDDELIKYISSN